VFLKRFFPNDRALARIGSVVHDLDLKDVKFHAPETAGVGGLLTGVAATNRTDENRIEAGGELFDYLHAYFSSDIKHAGTPG
jgi:hypothetical protein